MSARKRHVVEAIWSGYHSGQTRPCHRTVETWRAKWLSKVQTVRFTDGTTMSITVRHALPREKVEQIHGYTSLFDEIIGKKRTGFVTIESLQDEPKPVVAEPEATNTQGGER